MKPALIYGIIAYTLWGLFPIYWRALSTVSSYEVIANRVIWSLLFLVLLVYIRKDWRKAILILKSDQYRILILSSFLIGVNWLIYIIAVNTGHILDASLGYFICPLLNIFMGRVFLKEHLGRPQIFALLLVAFAVTLMVVQLGEFPFFALSLALTFSLYGLVRKILVVDSYLGLLVETIFMLPIALGYLVSNYFNFSLSVSIADPITCLLLVSTGLVTTLPLLCFVKAARELPLITIGFLQYLSPSIQFILAVWVYDEVVNTTKYISFALIWIALALHSLESIWRSGYLRLAQK